MVRVVPPSSTPRGTISSPFSRIALKVEEEEAWLRKLTRGVYLARLEPRLKDSTRCWRMRRSPKGGEMAICASLVLEFCTALFGAV